MKKGTKRILTVCLCMAMAVTSAFMLSGCGKDKQTPDSERVSDAAFTGKYLVTAKEAKALVGKKNVLFVDCRDDKLANKGTVKGAVVTSWQKLCQCSDRYGAEGDAEWGKIPAAKDLAKRLGDLGITKDQEIILIGQTSDGWGDDSRVLWELREAGFENAKMVDGGWTALKDAGIETQNGGSTPKKTKVKIDRIRKDHTVSTEDLQKNYKKYKIIDVRTDAEWKGATKYGEAKGGHIPGAVHVRYTDLFREDGTLVSKKDVEKMMRDAGISKNDYIVTYCTGGIRSAYMQLVLEMCGYPHTYNYDQSFWRWAKVGKVVK
ncbi:MAG: rhodanese-like domain-containing protein [Eubacterium pyruvativorans]|uniref:sulfurtransferase n=1 Tax=Eubacterium pyruvativorans TaxID=155865 RepID=UPI00240A66A1|nr:rhodanese-like domain-containing protein [Eubacterium pyruvativorans]MDD6707246.1 rhodanese-like domain-containing protein [Eubacterium pyruvativorans]